MNDRVNPPEDHGLSGAAQDRAEQAEIAAALKEAAADIDAGRVYSSAEVFDEIKRRLRQLPQRSDVQ